MDSLDGHPDLACSVCLQSFDARLHKPVSLGGCGHSFCLHCVNSQPSSFARCPECRARARGPPVINISLLRVINSLVSGAPAGPVSSRGEGFGSASGPHAPAQGPSAEDLDASAHAAGRSSTQLNGAAAQDVRGSNGSVAGTSTSQAAGAGGHGLWASILAAWGEGGHQSAAPMATRHQRRQPQPLDGMDARGFPIPSASGQQGLGGPGVGAPWAAGQLAGSLASPAVVAQAAQALPHALNEARSSFWNWAAPVLGLLYLISPLDLLPDFIPLIGWLDDLVVLGAVVYMLWSLANQHRAQHHTHHHNY